MKAVHIFFLYAVLILSIDLTYTEAMAQTVDPAAAVQLAVASPSSAQVAVATTSPMPGAVVGAATPSAPALVAVEEPAAPPQWVASIIVAAQKLPVVGPIVSKIILYAGVLSSILTALFAAFFTILSAMSGILNLAGLQKVADAIQAFKKGKVMYYLAYLSMFNAKKPV